MRRVVIPILLAAALVLTLSAWREAVPETRGVDGAAALTTTAPRADEVVLREKPERLTVGWTEHRTLTARAKLGLAVLVGLAVALAVAIARRHRLSLGGRSTLWRRSSAILRAPPALRLL
jgi:hypothetical protein